MFNIKKNFKKIKNVIKINQKTEKIIMNGAKLKTLTNFFFIIYLIF